jgi:mRNA interferase RelE/StbE
MARRGSFYCNTDAEPDRAESCALYQIIFVELLSIRDKFEFVVLIIPPRVFKELAVMPRADAKRLLDRLERIVAQPDAQHLGVTPPVGETGVYRLRQGDWRALFSIEDGDVIVDRVAHRREVYR